MRSWLRAGQVLTVVSIALLIVVQAVAGQWFPPPVSVSQYGVGPHGWIFSVWLVVFCLAPVCLERALALARARRVTLGRVLIVLGLVSGTVMAIVRTDAGGAQLSLNAKIHMIASICTLTFLPLGILALLWTLRGGWRWTGIVLIAAHGTSMALLLFAAAGYDTAGLGPHESWAFWQAVAVVIDIGFVVTLAVAAERAGQGSMSDHTAPTAERATANS